MDQRLKKLKILWQIILLPALISAAVAILNPGIYSKVVSDYVLPGVIAQDIITVLSAATALLLIYLNKIENPKTRIAILGIMGYLFYGYGIYVIEQIYTVFYLVYMMIFALASFVIVYQIINIAADLPSRVTVSKRVRIFAAGFLLVNPLIFLPLWISQLIALIATGRKPEFTYSVYILDLCFIMPAIIAVAYMAIKNKGMGLLLTPAVLIKGFTLLFSVALGGIIRFAETQSGNMTEILFYLVLSLVFLLLTIYYLRKLEIQEDYQ